MQHFLLYLRFLQFFFRWYFRKLQNIVVFTLSISVSVRESTCGISIWLWQWDSFVSRYDDIIIIKIYTNKSIKFSEWNELQQCFGVTMRLKIGSIQIHAYTTNLWHVKFHISNILANGMRFVIDIIHEHVLLCSLLYISFVFRQTHIYIR